MLLMGLCSSNQRAWDTDESAEQPSKYPSQHQGNKQYLESLGIPGSALPLDGV
jgi:hypothetical protein